MHRLAEIVLLIGTLSAGALVAQNRPDTLYVGSVSFKGNKAIDPVTLAASIATTPSSWLYRRFHIGDRNIFDETEFRRDVVRLQLFYRQSGFYEARIDTTVKRSGRFINPTFIIEEGPPIIIDTVIVTGIDSLRDSASIADGIEVGSGKRFDRALFEAAGDSISLHVRDRGYPYAIVFRNFTVNRLTRHATVQFDVLPGTHARIAEIDVTGTEHTRPATVRHALTIRPGDEYRATALYNSQRALYQSELFRYANVTVARPDSIVDGVDSLVRVRAQVAESDPLRARVGAGYGTIDCLRAQGSLTILNFLGEARRLDVVSRVSKIGVGEPARWGLQNSICSELNNDRFSGRLNYLGSVTLSQPVGFMRGAIASIQAFKERRSEFNIYLVTSSGGALAMRFGIGANRGIPVSTTYRLSREQTLADAATFCVYFNQCAPDTTNTFTQPRRLGQLSATLVNQRVDNPVEPSKGQTLSIELTSASRAFASQIVFDRVVLEGIVYRPVGRRKVFSARLRGGIIREGISQIGPTSSLRYVPPSERFYAGGPTTVRGYGRNEMGPVVYVTDNIDSTGGTRTYENLRSSPLGSSAIVLANAELRVPTPFLGGKLGMSVFLDGGELWDYDGSSYRPGGFKVTPGIGLQISTPLGPMRLSTAYNGYGPQKGKLYQISSDGTLHFIQDDFQPGGSRHSFLSRLQWHFSVGVPF